MSCADGDVLVIDTEIAEGSSLENGTITDGTAVQYKTTDSRSTKSSIWRNTGDFTIGSDGGGLGECASNSGGLVFDGPSSLPADSMWTTVSVDAASPTTLTLSAASPSSKYALFKVVLSSITATEAYKFKVEDNDLQLCILSPTKQFIAFQDDSSSLGGSFSDGYNPLIFIGGDNQVYGNQGSLSPEPYTFTAGTYYFIVNVYGGLSSGTRSGQTYVNKVANPFNP
jgi:hypothetical protein